MLIISAMGIEGDTPDNEDDEEDGIACVACGSLLAHDAVECEYCGTAIGGKEEE